MIPEKRRIAIFIDGSNLYHSLSENCRRFDLDFSAFIRKLCDGRPLFRAYYYNILQDPERNSLAYQEQQKFLATLYNTPYLEIRLGTSKIRRDMVVEKGVDIMIATDILQLAWNDLYDAAILISGDGDFAYALQAIKNIGKYAEVGAFDRNLAPELGQVADNRWEFTPPFFSDLWSNRKRRSRRGRGASSGGPSQPQEAANR